MRAQKIGLAILLSVTILGCAMFGTSKPTVYNDAKFSFQYPETWQTMADLWGDRYQPGQEYYQLGVNEIITVTSVRKQGESGAWFAVAFTPLAGEIDLETVASETYAPFMDSLKDYSGRKTTISGTPGFEVSYMRPWGEPWWQFRDIWLAHDSVLYVLSFHTYPTSFDSFQEDFDFILNSFALK
jgi:hypothetical protein